VGSSNSPRYGPLSVAADRAPPCGDGRGAQPVSGVDSTLYDAGAMWSSAIRQSLQQPPRRSRVFLWRRMELACLEYRNQVAMANGVDQYRYDALGRRVVVRTQRASEDASGLQPVSGQLGLAAASRCGTAAQNCTRSKRKTRLRGELGRRRTVFWEERYVPLRIWAATDGSTQPRILVGWPTPLGPVLDHPLSAIRINFSDTIFTNHGSCGIPITFVAALGLGAARRGWKRWPTAGDYMSNGGFSSGVRDVSGTRGVHVAQQPSNAANGCGAACYATKRTRGNRDYRRNRYVGPRRRGHVWISYNSALPFHTVRPARAPVALIQAAALRHSPRRVGATTTRRPSASYGIDRTPFAMATWCGTRARKAPSAP